MLKQLLATLFIVSICACVCIADDARTIDVAAAQAKLDAKTAARIATTQPAAATRPVVSIPSIEGVWEEAPGVLVTISQSAGKWNAKCEYVNGDKDDIKWEITSGTITADGKLKAKLHHTQAPAGWAMWQDREASLSKDGKAISGTASWKGGADKFTWTKTNPTEGAKDAGSAKPADAGKHSLPLHFENAKVEIDVTDVYYELNPNMLDTVKFDPAQAKDMTRRNYCLYAAITIKNKDERRRLTYNSQSELADPNYISITDDAENSVTNLTVAEGRVDGQAFQKGIAPSSNLTDIQLFEMPLPKTKSLTFVFQTKVLSFDNGDQPLAEDVKFTITPDQIKTIRH
jgi:hypothetical protein